MLDLMEAGQRTNERLVMEIDQTRNRTVKAESTTKFKPEKYGGISGEGMIDSWLMMMKIHLDNQEDMDENEKVFLVMSYLTKDARAFVLNKPLADRNTVRGLFDLLSRRLGTDSGRAQNRSAFASRRQKPGETINQLLDDLEGLRLRAYPQEDRATRDYEIMQKFMNGVSDQGLHTMLTTKYADESFVVQPPTVEQLRYVANEYVRLKGQNRPANWFNNWFPRQPPAPVGAQQPVPPVTVETPKEAPPASPEQKPNPNAR